jgi:hypothetical protein
LELATKACNHVKLVHGLSISLEENDEQGRYNNTDDKVYHNFMNVLFLEKIITANKLAVAFHLTLVCSSVVAID